MTASEKIKNGINRALKEGKTHFSSRKSAAEHCGVMPRTIARYIVQFIENGITVSTGLSVSEKKEITNTKFKEGIEKAKKEGILHFNFLESVAKYCGVGPSAVTEERIQQFKENGITVSAGISTSKKKRNYR